MSFTARRDLYSGKGSDVTSQVYWVGDAKSISLFLDGGSVQTVDGSNDDGRTSAIAERSWSTLTTLTPDATMLDIEPGFRWIRVLRSGSTGTAILELQQ